VQNRIAEVDRRVDSAIDAVKQALKGNASFLLRVNLAFLVLAPVIALFSEGNSTKMESG
jgi:hypothetical protein